MPITFSCRCGEQLSVDEAQRGRRAFCPKCRNSVEIPDAHAGSSSTAAEMEISYEGEIFEPPHLERVQGADGKEQWKLTCFCRKRILTPLQADHPVGRCPKCGRRLRLPGYKPKVSRRLSTPSGEPRAVPSASSDTTAPLDPLALSPIAGSPPESLHADAAPEAQEDEVGTIIMEPLDPQNLPRETDVGRDAAIGTADRLRAHKISAVQTSGPGLVSAWPLAGRLPRALAGFIDLTFGVLVASLLVGLASLGWLPSSCRHPAVALSAFVTVGLLNDILLQMVGGGLGKRLVVLAIRKRNGQNLTVPGAVVRSVLKLILFPGWLWALFDPAERTLHDLVCGTLVLKGRARS